MGVFKNGVGRPSNETIKKRRIITLVITLIVIGLIAGVTFMLTSVSTKKTKGYASGDGWPKVTLKTSTLSTNISKTPRGYLVNKYKTYKINVSAIQKETKVLYYRHYVVDSITNSHINQDSASACYKLNNGKTSTKPVNVKLDQKNSSKIIDTVFYKTKSDCESVKKDIESTPKMFVREITYIAYNPDFLIVENSYRSVPNSENKYPTTYGYGGYILNYEPISTTIRGVLLDNYEIQNTIVNGSNKRYYYKKHAYYKNSNNSNEPNLSSHGSTSGCLYVNPKKIKNVSDEYKLVSDKYRYTSFKQVLRVYKDKKTCLNDNDFESEVKKGDRGIISNQELILNINYGDSGN